MPRTKVSKSSKRNRETTNREEKIREFENSLEAYNNMLEDKAQSLLTTFEYEMKTLIQRTPTALLQMKILDVFQLNLKHFADWAEPKQTKVFNSSSQNSTLMRSARAINPNDEGYLTEDSSTGGSIGSTTGNPAFLSTTNTMPLSLIQQQSARLRTPGPLSSARARRPRRSQSASGNLAPIIASAIKQKAPSQLSVNGGGGTEHHSRSKMRTPMATRTKALSADRTPKAENGNSLKTSPVFLRFPKPGELVLSKCGSPLVAPVLPSTTAHINIPLRNGVISMRPRKLADVQSDMLQDIDSVTADELRTLKMNLDKIVNMVNNAGI
ncbi:borealin-like [Cochliomyia hominivorax]